jgi:hypothetical protein
VLPLAWMRLGLLWLRPQLPATTVVVASTPCLAPLFTLALATRLR